MEKAEARRHIREALEMIGEDDFLTWSETIVQHILLLPEFNDAGCVMLFASLPDEFDTEPLIDAALMMNKTVTLPRVDWRRKQLDIVRIDRVSELEDGYMGILESRDGVALPVRSVDFMLVPGLAFDHIGHRLGRGGGYYDRLLASPGMHAARCAAAFACQLLDYVPFDAHDQAVDLLVTEEGVMRFGHELEEEDRPAFDAGTLDGFEDDEDDEEE